MRFKSNAQRMAVMAALNKMRIRSIKGTEKGMNVYLGPEDVQKSGDFYQVKGKSNLMEGPIITKGDLPKILFHVTTNLSAIEKSGYLKAGSSIVSGGLGGHGTNAVSLTTSRKDAFLIKKELTRVIELGSSSEPFKDLLERYAKEDNFPEGVSEALKNYEVNWKNVESWGGDDKIKANREKSARIDALKLYRIMRESAGKGKDPIILGSTGFLDRDITDIGIVFVRSSGIPNAALIMEGESHTSEVKVFSDVPLIHAKTLSKAFKKRKK